MRATLLFLVLFLMPVAAPAAESKFDNWTTYYYKTKPAAEVGDYLKWLQESAILEQNVSAGGPVAAFLSIIFKDNPASVPAWLKGAAYTGKTRMTVEAALWLSNNRELLVKYTKKPADYTEKPTPDITKLPISSPGDIDMMWGAFMASGSDVYVKRIIDALQSADKATAYSADWSLGSNMRQHQRVYDIVEAEAKTAPSHMARKLGDLLAENTPRGP